MWSAITFSQNLSRMFAKDYTYIKDSTFTSEEVNFLVAKKPRKQCLDSKWIKVCLKTKIFPQIYLITDTQVKKRKMLWGFFKLFILIFIQCMVFSAIENSKIQQHICHKSKEITSDLQNGFEITKMDRGLFSCLGHCHTSGISIWLKLFCNVHVLFYSFFFSS